MESKSITIVRVSDGHYRTYIDGECSEHKVGDRLYTTIVRAWNGLKISHMGRLKND